MRIRVKYELDGPELRFNSFEEIIDKDKVVLLNCSYSKF